MQLRTIHCFLAHPAKHMTEQPPISGTLVEKQGRMYLMLKNIYDNAESDCRIEISFNHNSDGQQHNDCRDLLLAYIRSLTVEDGRKIALRLQSVTNEISGLGLLFLMSGKDKTHAKLVLSRFPADQGILAEENKSKLSVKFLEKVFMKSATAHKAAVYQGRPGVGDFWEGRAVDKQINNIGDQIANYWIHEFLLSDLSTTPAAGSRRLAIALRTAIHDLVDTSAKSEIAAAVTLIGSIAGQTISIESFCNHFGFSPQAHGAVLKAVKQPLMNEQFPVDVSEFKQHIAFRSLELDNGGILTSEAYKFDEVFEKETLDADTQEVQFTTHGHIVDQGLRKGKV
jgi:hypothetical protein